MSFVRPEAMATLRRQSELIAALCLLGFGAWVASRGGPVLLVIGLGIAAMGAGLALVALRRLRFVGPVAAPGMVEVDEGQIGYLGPDFGGYVAVRELKEVRLVRVGGRPHWQLRQSDGQALLVPHRAAGASALFDAFASLPGADMAAFTAALDQTAESRTVWRRG